MSQANQAEIADIQARIAEETARISILERRMAINNIRPSERRKIKREINDSMDVRKRLKNRLNLFISPTLF